MKFSYELWLSLEMRVFVCWSADWTLIYMTCLFRSYQWLKYSMKGLQKRNTICKTEHSENKGGTDLRYSQAINIPRRQRSEAEVWTVMSKRRCCEKAFNLDKTGLFSMSGSHHECVLWWGSLTLCVCVSTYAGIFSFSLNINTSHTQWAIRFRGGLYYGPSFLTTRAEFQMNSNKTDWQKLKPA